MTTRTDFQSICALRDTFKPAKRGFINGEEAAQVRTALELDARNDIELQNVRDMSVMLYGQWGDSTRDGDERATADTMALWDAMSAICAVIDDEKFKRGLAV